MLQQNIHNTLLQAYTKNVYNTLYKLALKCVYIMYNKLCKFTPKNESRCEIKI